MGKHLPKKGLALMTPDRRVRWSDRLLAVTALLMVWAKQRVWLDAYALARAAVVAMYPSRKRPGKTSKGFFQALRHRSTTLVARLKAHLQQETIRRAGRRWARGRWVGLAVDGSRIECPRTRANEEAFGCGGRTKTTPQQWVTTVYHVDTGLLWDYVRDRATGVEREHLLHMLPDLPNNALLLMDAGFTGYDFLSAIHASGRHFIVRAGGNVTLIQGLGATYDVRVKKSTVWLWPQGKQGKQPPLRLRRVQAKGRGKDKGKIVCLLTNVLSKDVLSDAQVKAWYRQRWGIEVQYRSLKQTLEHRKLMADSPEMARVELDWAMLGLWLLELMLVHAQRRRRGKPSIAQGLRCVREAMWRRGRVPRGGLTKALREAVQDSYDRTSSKNARDWPNKKNDPPCKPPNTRMATAKERQQAQAFEELKPAA
jgi:hypothetical protein